MKLPFHGGRKDFVKYFTKSELVSCWKEGDLDRIVVVGRRKEPPGLPGNEVVVREQKFGEELVAIGLIQGATGVAAVDFVFVVVVESVVGARTILLKSVRVLLFRFVKNDQLGVFRRLAGFTQVAPKAGFFDEVAATVVKVTPRFGCDLGFADIGRGE